MFLKFELIFAIGRRRKDTRRFGRWREDTRRFGRWREDTRLFGRCLRRRSATRLIYGANGGADRDLVCIFVFRFEKCVDLRQIAANDTNAAFAAQKFVLC